MRVRMKTLGAGPQGLWPPGAVIHVSEATGALLVAGGYAEAVETPAADVSRETDAPGVERAVDAAAEARQTATAPAQRRGKGTAHAETQRRKGTDGQL